MYSNVVNKFLFDLPLIMRKRLIISIKLLFVIFLILNGVFLFLREINIYLVMIFFITGVFLGFISIYKYVRTNHDEPIDHGFSATLFNVHLISFSIISILGFLTVIEIIILDLLNINLLENASNNQSIYSAGVTSIFAVVSIYIAVILFLIQQINDKFSPNISYKIVTIPSFLVILIFNLFYILYNLTAGFFQLQNSFVLISYILSIMLVLYLGSLIFFIAYFIQGSDLINYYSIKVIQFFSIEKSISTEVLESSSGLTKGLFSTLQRSKISTDIFKEWLQPLFTVSQISISKNNTVLLQSTTNSLLQIIDSYTKLYPHTIGKNTDEILVHIIDNFHFLIPELLENPNQKLSDIFGSFIGEMGIAILNNQNMEYGTNLDVVHILNTLEEFFMNNISKKRNFTCEIIIDSIHNILDILCEKTFRSMDFGSYISPVKTLSDKLLSLNHFWTASLVMRLSKLIALIVLSPVDIGKGSRSILDNKQKLWKIVVSNYYQFFTKYSSSARSYHETKFFPLFLQNRITYDLVKFYQYSNITDSDFDDRQLNIIKMNLNQFIEQIIEDFSKILIKNIKYDSKLIEFFPESLYIMSKKQSKIFDNDRNILFISKNWIQVQKAYWKMKLKDNAFSIYEFYDYSQTFYAWLIYLKNDKPELLEQIFDQLLDVYNDMRVNIGIDEFQKSNLFGFYHELKLYSAWISTYQNLQFIKDRIHETIAYDYLEPQDTIHSSYFESLGYASVSSISDNWMPRPSYFWTHEFSDIESEFKIQTNGIYEKNHKELKSKFEKLNSKETK